MAYPTSTLAGANAVKPTTAQSAIEDFDPVLSRLEQLVSRATNCGDRITGPRPQGVEAAKDTPQPNHLIYAIQSRRERLVSAVDFLEGEMSRIENGLA